MGWGLAPRHGQDISPGLFLYTIDNHIINDYDSFMDAIFALKHKEDLEKVVTMGVLLDYTDTVLLPGIERIVGESQKQMTIEMGKSENRMMDYIDRRIEEVHIEIGKSETRVMEHIDRRLTDFSTDLFKRLEQKFQTERQFKDKVVELFKRHNIGTSEDLAFLDGLVKGGW